MKNLSIRSVFATMLIILSIGSYIFLNTVPSSESEQSTAEKTQLEESPEQELFFPDVEIIKKVFKKGIRFLPKSI